MAGSLIAPTAHTTGADVVKISPRSTAMAPTGKELTKGVKVAMLSIEYAAFLLMGVGTLKLVTFVNLPVALN